MHQRPPSFLLEAGGFLLYTKKRIFSIIGGDPKKMKGLFRYLSSQATLVRIDSEIGKIFHLPIKLP